MGQQAFADGGRTPALRSVAPTLGTRPERICAIGADDLASVGKHERAWKDTFGLR